MNIELFKQLKNEVQELKYQFFQFDKINLKLIKEFAQSIGQNFDNVAIIGIGASSLNIKALISSTTNNIKKIIYFDSLDQYEIDLKLNNIDINRTLFFSISLSGNTHETYLLTQYLLSERKISPLDIIIITPATDNKLFNLSVNYKTLHFDYHKVESGRFGIISNATLLPAYMIGINIDIMVNYAQEILVNFLNIDKNLIIEQANWYIKNFKQNRDILVFFNYSFQLEGLCSWVQQIIAESLGKQNFGITPIIAKGTLDQHSQLQLYLEGPNNKFYQILFVRGKGLTLKNELHAHNIYNALMKQKREVKMEIFNEFGEKEVVTQIIKTMLIVILIAKMEGFNPFDQPAVDFYKKNITI